MDVLEELIVNEEDDEKLANYIQSIPKNELQARLNMVNHVGWSALHFAARYGKTSAVNHLLKAGALPFMVNKAGQTPLDVAIKFQHDETAKALGGGIRRSSSINNAGYKDDLANFFTGSLIDRQAIKRGSMSITSIPSESSQILPFKRTDVLMKKNYNGNNNNNNNNNTIGRSDLQFTSLNELKEQCSTDLDNVLQVYLGMDPASGMASFAIDVSDRPSLIACKEEEENVFECWGWGESEQVKLNTRFFFLEDLEKNGQFDSSRGALLGLNRTQAALVAQAKAIIDWNLRTAFCSLCGARTESAESGWKRVCNTDCVAQREISNTSYPRTDAVVISCVVSQATGKVLLGRKRGWAPNLYSCCAGFVEVGESLEEACRREIKEETDVDVGKVSYHSSQPWPFPSQLMLGVLAESLSENIRLNDDELEDARWFDREDVLLALKGDNPNLKLPPSFAIAHTLLKSWATSKATTPKL